MRVRFRFNSVPCYSAEMNRSKLIIRSGGQAGTDRSALDAAIEMGLPHCGWCPRGRKAEDGRIPDVYNLKETRTAVYRERTRLNVRDSDATVIFARLPLSGGTKLTALFCQRMRKPLVLIEPSRSIQEGARQLRKFLQAHQIRMLNVAGPRASADQSIYDFTKAVIIAALRPGQRTSTNRQRSLNRPVSDIVCQGIQQVGGAEPRRDPGRRSRCDL